MTGTQHGRAAIGLAGLGVMGGNLARNIAGHGYAVAGYDISPERSEAFLRGPAAGLPIAGVDSPAALVAALETPRRILMMVPAGAPVDGAIATLAPHLEPGDILIDGGNSWFLDTERRSRALEAQGLNFMGIGVSGGEEGALHGPSIMPGGQRQAYDALAPILRAIAAKAEDGEPCVDYMGPLGAGHFVKMVHNGIEYGEMQLLAETYDLLQRGLGLTVSDLHAVFAEWNTGELQSYLVEITARIFTKMDDETGRPLVDVILDEAAQKGTGKWTSQNALDVGAPIPTIDAAVISRILSSLKEERVAASAVLRGPSPRYSGPRQPLIDAARDALYASRIATYAQGLALLRLASAEYHYDLKPGAVAKIWRAGCIIRARLLGDITAAWDRTPNLVNLLLDDVFREAIQRRQEAWRNVVRTAVALGIPVLAISSSLAYFDAYRTDRLPANLTQAQRDYFGAHTFRRVDKGGVFHASWPATS
ncbi:MAG: phosphogluconate dehydrogenase (NADP(+)-dependent, decarboxylating) [Acidobacteria bacterium RIFCSPLOWO2_12_FULL_66_21]|nr:MAG: phosphogluconate dehydrogenase (NADP(+)-dependent, decarboxylating) [Acidobacteria bacterium RIFCSPLOWO2_12_FULL_66_21]